MKKTKLLSGKDYLIDNSIEYICEVLQNKGSKFAIINERRKNSHKTYLRVRGN